MKNDREEISTYYEGMPAVFEVYSEKKIDELLISEILVEKRLKLLSTDVGVGIAICENAIGERLLMKHSNNTEEAMLANVLPAVDKQNFPFRVLHFPKLVATVRDVILTKHIEGLSFNDTWDEASTFGYGGRGIELDFATRVVDLMADLSLIDTSLLDMFGLSTFDFDGWKKQNLPFLSEILIKRKLVDQAHINNTLAILSDGDIFRSSRMILTNGDFYPRNLIELPDGKIAIVDWEGRQDYGFMDQEKGSEQRVMDQRNAFVNFVENHVAFFYIHMWGNPDFQRKFVSSASQRFGLTAENLQAAILIKSLEQALIWPDDLAGIQIKTFMKALDINFVKELMK